MAFMFALWAHRLIRCSLVYRLIGTIHTMDTKLLELLVCPVTKGPLLWRLEQQELLSLSARLAYPVRDGIPVMLEHEARGLSEAEVEAARAKRPVDTAS